MAVRKKSPQIILLDIGSGEEVDPVAFPGQPGEAFPIEESDASLCLACGEPLAWHEEACSAADPVLPAPFPEAAAFSDFESGLAPVPFAYTLGQPVQPGSDARPHRIVWRGQVKERHPRTGLVRRVNVYRLDNGYWDCYYEAELRAA
ncbi:hypothetical protein K3G63_04140 [Hymenobacter sp. HSC-4F20]|uniref:hypothetical protein n=1 Tax=Hymenobacter sp. HSC-4F20 TaxID=2864135 RepID=UPI001C735828|nr:hypothetical protein [Hymenobacter sp. HSC-4F20]MBX0289613.1 hypothetical protein [Hymenobacter sp. HSC-4F20]